MLSAIDVLEQTVRKDIMTYYIHLEDNKIFSCGECPMGEPFQSIEVTEEIYNSFVEDELRYIWDGEKIVDNPNYEKDKADAEHERIMEMRMTPLDFLKAIEQYGITYDMVKQFMEQNPLIERELRFCQFVYRKHPMLDELATYGITSEILDNIFKVANKEE